MKKDEISSVFYPVRKSLSVRSPVSIPDVIATRSGKFVSLFQKHLFFLLNKKDIFTLIKDY